MNKWRGKFTDHTKLGLLNKITFPSSWSPEGPTIWWPGSPECHCPQPVSLPGPALISPSIHQGTVKTRVKQLSKMYCRFRDAVTATIRYTLQPFLGCITFRTPSTAVASLPPPTTENLQASPRTGILALTTRIAAMGVWLSTCSSLYACGWVCTCIYRKKRDRARDIHREMSPLKIHALLHMMLVKIQWVK